MKKKTLFTISCFLGLAVGVFFFYSDAIFQRGNPLPYVSKMLALSDSEQFAKVFADADIYLSRKSGYDDLIRHIESVYDVSFAERMGSAYVFSSDDKSVVASTEVYLRKYLVWEVETQIITVESTGFYETYAIDGFSFRYPAKWEITSWEETGGVYRVQLRDPDIESLRWHSVDVYTSIQIGVAELNENRLYQSARECMEKEYNGLRADDKEANLLVIYGIEISKVAHSRPYFSYKLIQMYFQYAEKEYNIGVHFDNDDDEIVEIVTEFLESLAFTRF